MTYYTYRHRPGYGREDHLADELIARAIRQLGVSGMGMDHVIAQHAGMAAHPVPMAQTSIRLPAVRGTAARMRGALRRARREWPHRTYGPDCAVVIERVS